ncbi:unnamed protein product [Tetraodon nigroviridis]|uniref:Glutamate-rich WD repeat-containing protein 1 n=1 Tax=Tetraodon nigroviridis TaxID=99883 RepID=Q4SN78_TETNG|nr:unnamed protein product [Tetraodon nigroviridis]
MSPESSRLSPEWSWRWTGPPTACTTSVRQASAPCLSFDVLRDGDGDGREQFPLSMLLCAGTQADTAMSNRLLVMRMFNLHGTERENQDEESSEEESDDDDEEKKPQMELAMMPHYGGINRVRVCLCASSKCDPAWRAAAGSVWSEKGQVEIFDLRPQLEAVHSSAAMAAFTSRQKEATSLFSFSGHMSEGFAIDWSPTVAGRLVSGDCKKNIHVWEPREGGTSWQIDQRPFSSHSKSVEDLQWSPTEATVFASCSVDQSIRIWDIRAPPNSMLSADEAHSSDVNVISWNRNEPFLLSGGDDGILKVWDLRQFKSGRPVATFKQHSAPVTSVEWSPTDSSVFAASGADDVVSQWDLSVESCDVGGPGGRSEGPASSAPVPAPGSDRGQGDPLAPAGPWRDGLHRSVRIQRVQDRVGVEDVWSGINPFKIPVGTSMSGAVNPCLIV